MKPTWFSRFLLCGALALVMAGLGTSPAGAAVEVTIPDANLAQCFTERLGLPAGTAVSTAQLAVITALACSEAGIVSLTGAEKLTRVAKLSLPDSEIANLAPLACLTSLTSLEMSGNGVTNWRHGLGAPGWLCWISVTPRSATSLLWQGRLRRRPRAAPCYRSGRARSRSR